jgi:Zn-dependent protease with chaperone function
MADQRLPDTPPRLNPFAFPSDTSFRFVLLIVAVVSASLFIYNWLYLSAPANKKVLASAWQALSADPNYRMPPGAFVRYQAAYSQANNMEERDKIHNEWLARNRARDDAFAKHMGPVHRTNAFWMIGGVTLLLVVAMGLYGTFPLLLIWRYGLRPVSELGTPEVGVYLSELCHEIGITRPPIFLINPTTRIPGGQAFGHLGRRYVSLTTGLILLFNKDRDKFRAVVLHELSHHYNADISKTYFSVAITFAFVLAALAPHAAGAWTAQASLR